MTARNDITGDAIASKTTTDAYRNNYDAIFRNKAKEPWRCIDCPGCKTECEFTEQPPESEGGTPD